MKSQVIFGIGIIFIVKSVLAQHVSQCFDLGPPHNGIRTPVKIHYQPGDNVTFKCNDGYTIFGKPVLTCQQDESWNGYFPFCFSSCKDPGIPRNAIRFANGFKHGNVVMFRCKKGYKLLGHSLISCLNGRWHNKNPKCVASCSDPGIPLNGKRLDHSYNHNDVVRFVCDKGWKINGVPAIKCNDGKWDHKIPKCLYDDCGKLGNANNDSRVIGMWPWQVFIKAKELRKSGWVTVCGGALIAPQWVLTAAHCVSNTSLFARHAKSAIQYKVVAGNPETRSYEPHTQERTPIQIHIHQGYMDVISLGTNNIALIKLNQKVSLGTYVRPVCLPAKNHGNYSMEDTFGYVSYWEMDGRLWPSTILHHSMCFIKKDSRRLEMFSAFCKNKTLKSVPCLGDTGSSMVRNVSVNEQNRFVAIGVHSFGGCTFSAWVSVYTRIESYIDWILYKINSLCLDPGVPRNGSRTPLKSIYQHEETVLFRCHSNYTMIGKPTLTCQQNGKWNGSYPLCLAPCDSLDGPSGGNVFHFHWRNFQHGHIVRFGCNKGYRLVGSSFATCINGHWDKTTPQCIGFSPKEKGNMTSKCPDPGQPRNGLRTPAKSLFYHGESARFQCISNYTLLGKSILTCQQNGTWNGIQPSCLAPCSDPVAPHLVRLDNDFQHGKTVRLKCKQRYTLVGSRRILCHNGKWFPMIPECKAPCADPGIPIGGIRLYNKSVYISERSVNAELFGYFGYFKHKTVLRFECTHLYWTLEGEKFLTCNDGQWNNVAPRCIHQFETVGCYKDSHIRSILSMRIGHFSNYRKNTISRKDFNDTISVCGLTALQMKCSVFGIQENGDCWCTHKDVSKLPLRYGKSNDCYQGVGTQRAIMVYSFKSLLKAGCFPANSLVELKTGDIVTMETLRIGDKVKTLELSTNKIFYTDVITFFHNEEIQRLLYCAITTENGNKLLISHKHLIYSGKTNDTMNMIYAADIQPGDFVLTGNRTLKVVSVMTVYDRGVYAPMTRHGTLLVNGIYVSSYAHHDSHELLHILVTPLRLWYDLSNFLRRVLAVIGVNLASNNGLTGTEMPQGIHGYIRFYMAMSKYFP